MKKYLKNIKKNLSLLGIKRKVGKYLNFLPKKSIKNQKKITSQCLQYKKDKDFYKSKRKQLKINYGYFQKNNFFKKNKKTFLFSFLGVFLGFIIFLVYGPIYSVKYINIIAQDSITNMSLSYSAIEDIYGKKMININKQIILNKLQQYQNNIKNIQLNYNLPDTLEIKVSSFPILFNTEINKKPFLVTQNGTLVPGKPRSELKKMVIKNSIDTNILPDYKQFYHQKYIDDIYKSSKYLEENVIDIKIKEIHFYPIQREVHFLLENNTLLIYTLSKNLKNQIEKTVIYNAEHKKLSDTDIVYIDFRIKRTLNNSQKDKIYYCTREIEAQCKKNLKKIYSL